MFKKDPSKFQGHVELARVLLEHGADVNAQDNEKVYNVQMRKPGEHSANGEEDAWLRVRTPGCQESIGSFSMVV
jgi:hypothetical protein